jgi:hypothetical protein
MAVSTGPTQMREFLKYWGLHDTNALANAPAEIVAGMDPATRQVIFVGIEDLVVELTTKGPVDLPPDRLAVYIDVPAGDEARWQLASMLADDVVLRRPRWERPIIFGHTIRELCEPEPEPTHLLPTAVSDTAAPLDPEVEAFLEGIIQAIDDEDETPTPPREEALAARLPSALSKALAFAAHLAAVGDGARLILAEPDLSSSSAIIKSLEGVYYEDGGWRVHDPWSGGKHPDAETFGEALYKLAPDRDSIDPVLGAYFAGARHGWGHLPLVTTSDKQQRVAVEFLSRFARLHFSHALVETGPRADAFLAPGTKGSDWRAALSDQMMVTAFPRIQTADLSTFEYLHALRGVAELRHRLRVDAERLENCTAAELQPRMAQIAHELRDVGERAKNEYAEAVSSDRKNLVLTWLANAAIVGAGFISFGLEGTVGGAAIAASVTTALEHKKLDPQARFTASELGLLALATGADPTRAPTRGSKSPQRL